MLPDCLAEDIIRKARTRLILSNPFFGFPAMQLELRADPNHETAYTNGRIIGYNPEFIEKHRHDENALTGLIGHETMHCMLQHPWRRNARDAELWNQACDMVVNGILIGAGFRIPSGGLYDPKYNGMNAEAVYEHLRKNPQDGKGPSNNDLKDCPEPSHRQGDGQGQGEPQDGQGKPQDQKSTEEIQSQWKANTAQAAEIAKATGKLPGNWEQVISRSREKSLDWKSILRQFIAEKVPSDYSWFPPSRRHLWQGLYLPQVKQEYKPRLVIAVDTSGSVTDKELEVFFGELDSIMAENPVQVDLVTCDTQVLHVGTFFSGPLKIDRAYGRGGTKFSPPIDWTNKHRPDCSALIYFTDGYGAWPAKQPGYPVLWIVTTEQKPAWGLHVKMET